jgi:lipopolysaccharide/colanic/teichoic acid biosynthesis glycosyltransferase
MYLPIKRFLDVVLSVIGMVFLAPVFLVIAIIIKLDSPGSVFFQQKRIGVNGKHFTIHKFRTMKANTEDWKATLSEEEQQEFIKDFKLAADPRVTRKGDFLRKTSLDELPQLYNILKGDLSIVGPRPVVQDELSKYRGCKDAFLSVKPGLTGYWQVNGRNDTTYKQRIEMELHYVDNFSIIMDFTIFCKTFLAVLRKTGM